DLVKRMYGCAITCSDTSSTVGVSQAGFFWSGAGLMARASLTFGASIVTLVSLMRPPFGALRPSAFGATYSPPRGGLHRPRRLAHRPAGLRRATPRHTPATPA